MVLNMNEGTPIVKLALTALALVGLIKTEPAQAQHPSASVTACTNLRALATDHNGCKVLLDLHGWWPMGNAVVAFPATATSLVSTIEGRMIPRPPVPHQAVRMCDLHDDSSGSPCRWMWVADYDRYLAES